MMDEAAKQTKVQKGERKTRTGNQGVYKEKECMNCLGRPLK